MTGAGDVSKALELPFTGDATALPNSSRLKGPDKKSSEIKSAKAKQPETNTAETNRLEPMRLEIFSAFEDCLIIECPLSRAWTIQVKRVGSGMIERTTLRMRRPLV